MIGIKRKELEKLRIRLRDECDANDLLDHKINEKMLKLYDILKEDKYFGRVLELVTIEVKYFSLYGFIKIFFWIEGKVLLAIDISACISIEINHYQGKSFRILGAIGEVGRLLHEDEWLKELLKKSFEEVHMYYLANWKDVGKTEELIRRLRDEIEDDELDVRLVVGVIYESYGETFKVFLREITMIEIDKIDSKKVSIKFFRDKKCTDNINFSHIDKKGRGNLKVMFREIDIERKRLTSNAVRYIEE